MNELIDKEIMRLRREYGDEVDTDLIDLQMLHKMSLAEAVEMEQDEEE